jgi:hypothetical protein
MQDDKPKFVSMAQQRRKEMADRELFLTKVENQRFKTAEVRTLGTFIGIAKSWVNNDGASGPIAYFKDLDGGIWSEKGLKNFAL